MFVRVTLCLFITLLSVPVLAEVPIFNVNEVAPGGLYFATDKPGKVVRAPTLTAEIDVTINGPLVRTRVVQSFTNNSDAFVEGLYTFPLPVGAAVDTLEMIVGDRKIVGVIKEKQEAQNIYDQASSNGQRASLIIQRRPNIFSTRVANIGPQESIKIAIEYQDIIEPRDNLFEFRFPMVVRPRYIPGQPLNTQTAAAGWVYDTDQVLDGSSITQPHIDGFDSDHNPVSMNIKLNAGFPLESLNSPSHRIISAHSDKSILISLAEGSVPADQDFILRWTPQKGSEPKAALFSEQMNDKYYHLLFLMPSVFTDHSASIPSRNLMIVLDKSGSMSGQAIRQAKSAVRQALMRLRKKDSFNIVAFDSSATSLFSEPQPVSDRSLAAALDFLDEIEADGGTEMSGALALALPNDMAGSTSDAFDQIIFVTDGAVGNELHLLSQIKNGLGKARLFTVGIGSAPNNYFMTEAALAGRGTSIKIAMNDDVLSAMGNLFAMIEQPQLTDIEIQGLPNMMATMPHLIPDLYSGHPITLAFQTNTPLTGEFSISGQKMESPWVMNVEGSRSISAIGIARLWARKAIDSINRSHIGKHSEFDQKIRRNEITALALDHHLISEFTSLVAVEDAVLRPENEQLYSREVPANIPAGMDVKRYTLQFGDQPPREENAIVPRQTATSKELYLCIGLILFMSGMAILLMYFYRREVQA